MIGVNDDLDIKVICYIDLDYFILAELSQCNKQRMCLEQRSCYPRLVPNVDVTKESGAGLCG